VLEKGKEHNFTGMLCKIVTLENNHHEVHILDNFQPDKQPPSLIKCKIEDLHQFFAEKKDMRLYNYF
jgi:hypothetical protein